MAALALLLRMLFSLGSIAIVVIAVLHAWSIGQPLLALAAFVTFPITFFVYPWIAGLVPVWVVVMLAFWGANLAESRIER
jgi:uncharacterized protein YacL